MTNNKPMKRFTLAMILALTVGMLASTGCIGNFGLGQNVKKVNLSITENRNGREGIFLGCTVFGVNALAFLLDIVIFNSIEFWSGENPLTGQPALVNVPRARLTKIFGEGAPDTAQIQRVNDTEAKMFLAFHNGDKMTFDVIRTDDTYTVSYLGRKFYSGTIKQPIVKARNEVSNNG
jgi:hypothetical protein